MNGVNFKIYAGKGEGETKTYVPVGGQRGGKLNRSADTVDVTTKDGNGWKESRTGLKEWSIDGDGIFIENNEGYLLIEEAFLNNKVVVVRMATEGLKYEGEAVITDFPLDMPFDNEVTYSVKLQGTGALKKMITEDEELRVKKEVKNK